MKRSDFVNFAREEGLTLTPELERFAERVSLAKREECLQICKSVQADCKARTDLNANQKELGASVATLCGVRIRMGG
jgi:hypothetical protein